MDPKYGKETRTLLETAKVLWSYRLINDHPFFIHEQEAKATRTADDKYPRNFQRRKRKTTKIGTSRIYHFRSLDVTVIFLFVKKKERKKKLIRTANQPLKSKRNPKFRRQSH